jgi:hypothetical protein
LDNPAKIIMKFSFRQGEGESEWGKGGGDKMRLRRIFYSPGKSAISLQFRQRWIFSGNCSTIVHLRGLKLALHQHFPVGSASSFKICALLGALKERAFSR